MTGTCRMCGQTVSVNTATGRPNTHDRQHSNGHLLVPCVGSDLTVEGGAW